MRIFRAEKVRVSAQLQQAQMDMSNHDQKLRAMEQDLIRYRDRCSDLETKSVHVHVNLKPDLIIRITLLKNLCLADAGWSC